MDARHVASGVLIRCEPWDSPNRDAPVTDSAPSRQSRLSGLHQDRRWSVVALTSLEHLHDDLMRLKMRVTAPDIACALELGDDGALRTILTSDVIQ